MNILLNWAKGHWIASGREANDYPNNDLGVEQCHAFNGVCVFADTSEYAKD